MKRINIIWAFVAAILLSVGCTRTEENLDTAASGEYKSRIVLKTVQSVTRAGATADDEVNKLDILIFKGSKLEKYLPNITSFGQTSDGLNYVEIGMEAPGTRSLFVIANYDDDVLSSMLIEGISTIDIIKHLYTGVLTRMANPPLVMYGQLDNVEFNSLSTLIECPLSRVVSRIDVINEADNFVLTSAKLLNSRTASNLFPSKTPYKSELADFEAIPAVDNFISLYTYENTPTDETDATAIELTGTVNGAELTYTVDLKRDGAYIPLERNFRYTVSVNAITINDISIKISILPWIIGGNINGEINGDSPVYQVTIPAATGVFDAETSKLAANASGGALTIDTQANAECAVETDANWIEISSTNTRAAAIEGRFEVILKENTDATTRKANIVIYNRLNKEAARTILVEQEAAPQGEKYMVVVVAGQSNAVGYDRSGYNATTDTPDPRAFQLSYRRGAAPTQNLSVIPLTHNADNIDPGAVKGPHLPLAKELLKYIPAGYKILVVPVAYTSSVFGTLGNSAYGSYNSALLSPNEMTQPLRWSKGSPYARTIIDRTKYVMEKFPASKFLGIVWCQGENDKGNSDLHYPAFTSFAEDVLDQLQELGPRTAYGVVDKRLWFNYTPCIYWVNWYNGAGDGDATGVFGGYKHWNPNNFIHIPATEANSNPTDKYHYGKNAFAELVAPLVAKRMNDNGALMNGVTGVDNHFADKTTSTEAAAKGGSMSDQDVTTSLQLFMPFRNTLTETLAGRVSILSNKLTLEDAEGLKDINGNPRSSKALKVESNDAMKFMFGPTVNSWSISFLAKRYGNNTRDYQAIITNSSTSTSPFIGFKKYFTTAGMARNAEFMMEPLATTVKNNALPGLFMYADNVRNINDWIHYVVTFDNATKRASVYMNGELVEQRTINTTTTTSLRNMVIGSPTGAGDGAEVYLIDLGIWSKVLSQSTITKLFLMSYYDYTK